MAVKVYEFVDVVEFVVQYALHSVFCFVLSKQLDICNMFVCLVYLYNSLRSPLRPGEMCACDVVPFYLF